MSKDSAIYTRTMAEVFSRQGHHDRAIEIYQYLLKKHPDQPDLTRGLKEAKRQLNLQQRAYTREFSVLIREWIELMQKYRLLKKLNFLLGRNQ